MNLLNGTPNNDKQTMEEYLNHQILQIKNELFLPQSNRLRLSGDEFKLAEQFLDFSKEMDLTLLENFELREPSKANSRALTALWWKLINVRDNKLSYEFSDRYILLIDALFGSQMSDCFDKNFDLEGRLNSRNAFSYRLEHAYERRYSKEQTKLKMVALMSEVTIYYSPNYTPMFHSPMLLKMAQENPEILYNAGKYYCNSRMLGSKLQLYAIALAYSIPDNVSPKNSDSAFKSIKYEYSDEMIDFVKEVALSGGYAEHNGDWGDIVTNALFMSVNHSLPAENFLRKQIKRNPVRFLKAVYMMSPVQYSVANAEKLFEILEVENNENFVKDMIKLCVSYFKAEISREEREFGSASEVANVLLKLFAENCPEQYISVMKSTYEIRNIRNGVKYKEKYYCCFYEELYNILQEVNPNAITEYGVNFDEDILTLAIRTEQLVTEVRRVEIGKYLRGTIPFEEIVAYSGEIAEGFIGGISPNNYKLISLCNSRNQEFKQRYFALKSFQWKHVFTDFQSWDYCKCTTREVINDIVSCLNAEKVPFQYRMEMYDCMESSFYSDENRKKNEQIFLDIMLSYSESNDSEYKKYCPKASGFIRKVYTMYLIASDDENKKNKDCIIALCGDTSKEIRSTITEALVARKDYESEVIDLLKAKKSAVRETAVDVLALWGVNNYRDILTATADKEKSVKLSDKIRSLLASSAGADLDSGKSAISTANFVNDVTKGGRNKKIQWLYQTPNHEVHFKNGDTADDKYLQAILICYSSMTEYGVSENAKMIAQNLNKDELSLFAGEIFAKWIANGADTKKKWVLYFVAIHGGTAIIDPFLMYIKEWAEGMRGAIAAEAVRALSMNGSSEALMAVDNMAHKFKQRQVKKAAAEAIENAAEALGITADELGDRIVPDLGFDESMQRIFDYGARKFNVYLTPTLELEIFDENDKKLKNLPAPSKKDNEEIASNSEKEFKQMKRQLKKVVTMQKLRLENALLADRRWDKDSWENLFVKNPIMHSFAIGLVWVAYNEDNSAETFRYMEDGTFNTSDEDEYKLSESCTIGLVHPIDFDEDIISAWKEQLNDYEIEQPIEQLNRKINLIQDEEKGKIDLERFKGCSVNGMSLMGRALKLGWNKGSTLDGGGIEAFYREDPLQRLKSADGNKRYIGNAVELHFDGMYIGGDDRNVIIENVRFYTPGDVDHRSYSYDSVEDSEAIPLDKVPPRYFSEIINQLEEITKPSANKSKK